MRGISTLLILVILTCSYFQNVQAENPMKCVKTGDSCSTDGWDGIPCCDEPNVYCHYARCLNPKTCKKTDESCTSGGPPCCYYMDECVNGKCKRV